MRHVKLSDARMSAIANGHYLGKREGLDARVLGWESFRLRVITESTIIPQLIQRHPDPQTRLKSNESMKYAWTINP